MCMRIGIDLGGTKIEGIAIADDGRERMRRRIPAPRDDYAKTLEAVAGLPCIRAARLRMRVPEVVSLTHYDRLPSTAVTADWMTTR